MDRTKYKDQYRISSTRLSSWDYGANSAYFVTICTKDNVLFFGKKSQHHIQLSQSGHIAQNILLAIPEQFPFVTLDEFIVMPDHLHAIIILEKPDTDAKPIPVETSIYRVSGGMTSTNNPMLYKNLSTIIRWYKGRVTFEVHKFNRQFAWQARFYEHIIRNEKRLQQTREYIMNNPRNW